MIGQYLSNNNEKSYSVVLQKFLELNQPLGEPTSVATFVFIW
jgi:hypothetical protein